MTDLRDHLADFEAAAHRALTHRPRPTTLPRTGLGSFLRRLRHDAGLTLDQVAARVHITRKGMCNRELHGSALPAAALVEHLAALGYDLALVPHAEPGAGLLTPDRRTA